MENKMLIVILLLLVPANLFTAPEATESEGGKCPPGHFMFDPEGPRPCRPCPPGTYQSKHSRVPECLPHSESCQDQQEEKVSEGDGTQDIVCQCREGHERKYIIHDPFRGLGPQIIKYLCSPCPAGYVAKPVSDPLKPGDTQCCLPHLFPVRRDLEFLCESATSTTSTTTTTTTSTTSHIPSTTTAASSATTELGSTASTGTTTPTTPHRSTTSSPTSPSRFTSVMTTPFPAVTSNLSNVNPVSDGAAHKSAEGWFGNPVFSSIAVGVSGLLLCLLVLAGVCYCRRHRRNAGNPAVPHPEASGAEHTELI